MDQPTPEAAPTPMPSRASKRAVAREDRTAQRLQSRVDTNEPLVAWTRGWVSRDIRLHGVFAARTLDFAVLTEHWFFLLNTGFFTRRPRRCVYAARIGELFVTERTGTRGNRLRISSPKGRPLLLELRPNDQTAAFAAAMVAGARPAPHSRGSEPDEPEAEDPEPRNP